MNPNYEAQQRFHGERVEARQNQNRRPALDSRTADALFTALLLDIIASASKQEPRREERIEPFVDSNEPPFFKFWLRLNAELTAAGKPEAGYGMAREAFSGGKTPVGALTFIGNEWEGLRAVPAKPVAYLGGARPAYHGEYRTVSDRGTVWHKVRNDAGNPISYALPEAAIVAAKEVIKS